MKQFYMDVYPLPTHYPLSVYTNKYFKMLLTNTKVSTDKTFDTLDIINLINLDAANRLEIALTKHNIKTKIRIKYHYLSYKHIWILFIETIDDNDNLDILVSKFFRWKRKKIFNT